MRRKLYLALCCVGIVLALGIMPASVRMRMESAVGDAFTPFASFWGGIRDFHARLTADRENIFAENEEMRIALARGHYEIVRLKWLEQENRRMSELLGMAAEPAPELIAGKVVARDVSGWWRKIRLNIGSDHGVETGMPVVSGAGLVGRTAAVSARRCDVLLMLDPSFRVSARATGSGAFGIVRGRGLSERGELVCTMEYVARGAGLKPGDALVTSGLGGVFPPGIPIGRVSHVYAEESGLYQNADVAPSADFKRVDFVFVLVSTNAESRVLSAAGDGM